jgi:hypothetical protein
VNRPLDAAVGVDEVNDVTSHDEVVVERVEVPAWRRDLLLAGAHRAELLILPVGVRDGRGVYRDDDLLAVKRLRAAGVSVDWAHPASERTFRSRFGVGGVYNAALPVAIGLFIMQALAEHSVVEVARYLQMWMRQFLAYRPPGGKPPTFTVNLDRMVEDGDRTEIEGLRITGNDPEQVVEAFRSVLRRDE